MTGFIVFAHGSRIESANQAVRDVVAEMATSQMAASGQHAIEAAFLELGQPDLAGATELLMARGAKRIVVIPYFLTLGTHMQRDLPRLAHEASRANSDIEIAITPPLDGHPALVQALLDRANDALARSALQYPA
ncbi:MAG: CbiX/SirB N-terminal domain-containing protein [Bryobacterales bacterium]|nr:CbiX/SirB N-terminal domain-containing protein [Bryobacterales bacterium]